MALTPIITSLYIPDPKSERHADTAGLVRQCVENGPRGRRRLVCPDQAPPPLIEWFRDRGDVIVEPTPGVPPRMVQNLERALSLVDSPLVWTIEQDVLVLPTFFDEAERIFEALAENVAAMMLASYCVPNRRFESWLENEPAWGVVHTGAGDPMVRRLPAGVTWSATLWRTDALRRAGLGRLPPLRYSHNLACKILGRVGWQFVGARDLVALHWSNSSHDRGQPL